MWAQGARLSHMWGTAQKGRERRLWEVKKNSTQTRTGDVRGVSEGAEGGEGPGRSSLIRKWTSSHGLCVFFFFFPDPKAMKGSRKKFPSYNKLWGLSAYEVDTRRAPFYFI